MVSVIMPVLNREDFLPATLKSVEEQTYKDWELIMIDDGSEDKSVSIAEDFVERHPGKACILHSDRTRSGASACRNLGTAHAAGKYIVFLDSDDLLAPFCLQQRVEVMQKDGALDWAVFNQYEWHPDKEDKLLLFNKKTTTREDAIHFFLQMDPPWQTMAPIWKKKTLIDLKGFDENLFYMEDPDLHLRALLDENLQVAIKADLPPDCYYRASNMDAEKINSFYHNSIVNRFVFLRKVLTYLPENKEQFMNKKFIRKGFFLFTKTFLLARIKTYEKDFIASIDFLVSQNVLSISDKYYFRLIKNIFTSNSSIISGLRIRGLIFKFLLSQFFLRYRKRYQ